MQPCAPVQGSLAGNPRPPFRRLEGSTASRVGRAGEATPAEKIASSTVNKLLGGVQAVALWGLDNGPTPDDVPWADPFARMRLDEEEPQREPSEVPELQLLFSCPIFYAVLVPMADAEKPPTGSPLLALFTGVRQGELLHLSSQEMSHGIMQPA